MHPLTEALVRCLQYVEVIKHFGLYSKREFLKRLRDESTPFSLLTSELFMGVRFKSQKKFLNWKKKL